MFLGLMRGEGAGVGGVSGQVNCCSNTCNHFHRIWNIIIIVTAQLNQQKYDEPHRGKISIILVYCLLSNIYLEIYNNGVRSRKYLNISRALEIYSQGWGRNHNPLLKIQTETLEIYWFPV
jgi:hypothetical protein